MKKLMFLFCITLFFSFAVTSPAISDTTYGYSAVSVTSMDGLIDTNPNVVDVGNPDETTINTCANCHLATTKLTTGANQTDIGLNSNQPVSLYYDQRPLPIEVGWRS